MEASEAKLTDSHADFEAKLTEEKSNMTSQLRSHAESIQILVMEKTDLEGLLSKTQVALTNKDGQSPKLQLSVWFD